ncbi:hypothetical protein GCM10027612_15620 [Microbispora bryophytorum subsp. camponoti]
MAGRKRSIRFKIFAILLVPLTALVVIWGFAAALTIEQGKQLLRIQKVYDNIVYPVGEAINELQSERFVSVSYLAWRTSALHTDLRVQRRKTDATAVLLSRLSEQARDETPSAMWDRLQDLIRQLDRLDVLRGQVDDKRLTRLDVIEEYSSVVETAHQVYDRLMISPDIDIIEQTKALILITRSREMVSQQSALVLGAQASGRMTQDERDAFSGMVGKRRLLYQLGTSQLDAGLLKQYGTLNSTPTYTSFLSLEDDVIARVRPGQPLPPEAIAWPTTAQALTRQLTETTGVAAGVTAARAAPLAQSVLWDIGIVGGLGLAAVLATAFISFRFARTVTGELSMLHRAAADLAGRRLPDLVRRLRRGEDIDVAAETPPMAQASGTVEIENVGRAFTSVQHTAIEAAVGQAELRKGVNKVFLNLARRSQSLLQRQLGMLDGLEKEITDPDLLERLFGVDHLTTRMRRHSEGLIILSGAVPGRGWRNPVRLYDVARAATEEVEDYLRVDVNMPHGYSLAGGSVTDVVHLLAELIENATVFSPPQTRVQVRGSWSPGASPSRSRTAGSASPRRSWRTSTRGSPTRRSSTWPTATGSGCSSSGCWPGGTTSASRCAPRRTAGPAPCSCSRRRSWWRTTRGSRRSSASPSRRPRPPPWPSRRRSAAAPRIPCPAGCGRPTWRRSSWRSRATCSPPSRRAGDALRRTRDRAGGRAAAASLHAHPWPYASERARVRSDDRHQDGSLGVQRDLRAGPRALADPAAVPDPGLPGRSGLGARPVAERRAHPAERPARPGVDQRAAAGHRRPAARGAHPPRGDPGAPGAVRRRESPSVARSYRSVTSPSRRTREAAARASGPVS